MTPACTVTCCQIEPGSEPGRAQLKSGRVDKLVFLDRTQVRVIFVNMIFVNLIVNIIILYIFLVRLFIIH